MVRLTQQVFIMAFNQIQSSIAPTSADPSGFWHDCRLNHEKCTPAQMRFLQGCSTDHKTCGLHILKRRITLIVQSFSENRIQGSDAESSEELLNV